MSRNAPSVTTANAVVKIEEVESKLEEGTTDTTEENPAAVDCGRSLSEEQKLALEKKRDQKIMAFIGFYALLGYVLINTQESQEEMDRKGDCGGNHVSKHLMFSNILHSIQWMWAFVWYKTGMTKTTRVKDTRPGARGFAPFKTPKQKFNEMKCGCHNAFLLITTIIGSFFYFAVTVRMASKEPDCMTRGLWFELFASSVLGAGALAVTLIYATCVGAMCNFEYGMDGGGVGM